MRALSVLGRAMRAGFIVLAVTLAAGCSGSYSRGQFQGFVMGNTAEDVEQKVGKPVSIDADNPDAPRWVYQKKTFDPDNFNKVDEKTTIILQRKDGKLIAVDILFG